MIDEHFNFHTNPETSSNIRPSLTHSLTTPSYLQPVTLTRRTGWMDEWLKKNNMWMHLFVQTGPDVVVRIVNQGVQEWWWRKYILWERKTFFFRLCFMFYKRVKLVIDWKNKFHTDFHWPWITKGIHDVPTASIHACGKGCIRFIKAWTVSSLLYDWTLKDTSEDWIYFYLLI